MQTFTSAYGRDGIVVSDECPTNAIGLRLLRGNYSRDSVEPLIRSACARERREAKLGIGDIRWLDINHSYTWEEEAIRYALWFWDELNSQEEE